MHKDFIGMGAATIDESNGLYHGHYPGGVALFWKKEISTSIKRLEFNADWAVAIEINLGTSTLVILNIYMPYQCIQNKEQYIDNLWNIYSFIDSINTTNFMIIGDWNANLGQSGNSLFGSTMVDFCEENNLVITTKELLPSNSYSHITNRTDNIYKTWIDHVVSSQDTHTAIDHIDMLYNITDEDHIPFVIHLNMANIPKVTMETNNVNPRINWHNLKDPEITKYYNNTQELLGKIKIPTEAINCQNLKCQNE